MLRFCDSFDHYGSTSTPMLDGVYAEVGGSPSTEHPRTGARSYKLSANGTLRRVLGVTASSVGVGGAYYFNSIPSTTGKFRLMSWRDVSNNELVRVELQTTGALRVVNGLETLLYETTVPVVTAAAQQHVEAQAVIDSSNGAVEVRVNEVTVINITGVNTQGAGTGGCAQIVWRAFDADEGFYVDDIFAWDTSGSFNNDFIGDKKVVTLMPVNDTSSVDYTPFGTADGFDAMDELDPNDATDYISFGPITGSVEEVGEFGIDDLASDVVVINAVQLYVRAQKSDAGTCTMRNGLTSNVDIAAGDLHSITTQWTYWMDIFESDPHTGAPWTRTAFNAADLRLTRED